MANCAAIGQRLLKRATGLFGMTPTVTPYDPINGFFKGGGDAEGGMRNTKEAKRPHAGDGRQGRCRTRAASSGARRRPQATSPEAPKGALVADRGVARLRREGCRYLVAGREPSAGSTARRRCPYGRKREGRFGRYGS